MVLKLGITKKYVVLCESQTTGWITCNFHACVVYNNTYGVRDMSVPSVCVKGCLFGRGAIPHR